MLNTTKIPLVSSEISGIWNSYVGETLLLCKFKYFLNRVEDTEIKDILQYSLDLCNQRIEKLTNILNQEKLPVPEGLKDTDININAPRLFSDTFYLHYISYASRVALQNYTINLSQTARSDIREYFAECIQQYIDLYNRAVELELSKSIFIKTPHVETPKKIEYVKNESFMMNWFGEKRALLTGEITHLFSISFASLIREALLTAFAQVCEDKRISSYILRGKDLAAKQTSMLNSILEDEDIPTPSTSDSYVTDSKIAPFSEKLMLNKILIICSAKINSIGIALSDAKRNDLQTTYLKFINELIKYSKDGLDIMIHNGWFEQPPQAIRHKNLVGAK